MKAFNEVFIYLIDLENNERFLLSEYIDWCTDTFGEHGIKWHVVNTEFDYPSIRFLTEEDRNWFMLRWSNEQY